MEKENYLEIIVEAMRITDKHFERGAVIAGPKENYSQVWIETFKKYANAALELVKPVEKSN